jgi:hypothetical protein
VRPRDRRPAEQHDELAASHSMTSSARASSACGTRSATGPLMRPSFDWRGRQGSQLILKRVMHPVEAATWQKIK